MYVFPFEYRAHSFQINNRNPNFAADSNDELYRDGSPEMHERELARAIASPMPKFSQVVVLPVPPFWLTMAIVVAFFEIFITSASLNRD